MGTIFTTAPSTWEEASAYPELTTIHAPFGIPCLSTHNVRRFATVQSLCRISGGANPDLIDSLLDIYGYEALARLLLNGFSPAQLATIYESRPSHHTLREFLTTGPGPFSPAEMLDYISVNDFVSVDLTVLLVLQHYGVATPERTAQLSQMNNLTGTLLDMFLFYSSDPAADADRLAAFAAESSIFARLPSIEDLCLAQQHGLTDVAQILDFIASGSRLELFDFYSHLGLNPLTCHGKMPTSSHSHIAFMYNAGHTDYQSLSEALSSVYERLFSSDPTPAGPNPWSLQHFFTDLQNRLGSDLAWRVVKVFPGAHATLKAARRSKKLAAELATLDDDVLRCVLTLAEEAAAADRKTPSVADYRAYIKTFA